MPFSPNVPPHGLAIRVPANEFQPFAICVIASTRSRGNRESNDVVPVSVHM